MNEEENTSTFTFSGVTNVTGVTANEHGDSRVTSEEVTNVTGVTPDDEQPLTEDEPIYYEPTEPIEAPPENEAPYDLTIPEEARSCYRVFDEASVVKEHGKLRAGVWYFSYKEQKEGLPILLMSWVCSPLHVDAVTFDNQQNNFGRMLRFKNTLGKWRTFSMPMELLKGSGEDLRGELLSMGVHIDPHSHRSLGLYLQALRPNRASCAWWRNNKGS